MEEPGFGGSVVINLYETSKLPCYGLLIASSILPIVQYWFLAGSISLLWSFFGWVTIGKLACLSL